MRVPPGRTLWMAALAAALASALAAQEPADRAALERLRDSLSTVTDSVSLRRLEAASIAVAKTDRDNPLIHLRLGFIAYRLGELAHSKSHYDDAAGEFEWASELRSDWPYPWYGLGLSELAQGEHSMIALENLKQQLGIDYLSKAARDFARATQADASFAVAAIDLAHAALAQRIRPQLDVALQAVRLAAASAAGKVPAVQLARGRVEREVGAADSALVAFHTYLALGADSGVGFFELARTQFYANRPAQAESSYYTGAREARSTAALALYRTDLRYLADSAEVARFDAQPDGAARAAWLRRFWGRRDVAEARSSGERLAEHNRRWRYALEHFRLVSRHRHYDITEVYRSAQTEFDDRGIIYIRHGPPDRRAVYVGPGTAPPRLVEPNESWLYQREGGNEVFHFVSRGDVQDYKLVESALDAMGFGTGVLQGRVDSVAARVWDSRAALDPMYTRLPNRPVLSAERSEGHRMILLGTTTDSYVHRFAEPLDLVVSDFVAGAGAGATDGVVRLAHSEGDDGSIPGATASGGQALHVVVAIPAERLDPVPGGQGVVYPVHFRLLVATPAESLVAGLDTVRYFTAARPLRAPSFLSARLRVRLPPGHYRYHLLVETRDRLAGQVVERDSVEVPALDGRHYATSDVVLGRAGGGLVWRPVVRGDSGGGSTVDTVLLAPLRRFPRDSVLELYYEVYGLAAGAPYHTQIRVERTSGRSVFKRIAGLFGGRHPPVLLDLDAPAAGPVTRVHRGVSLRGVPAGRYRLTVTLTDPSSGAVSSRVEDLQVVDAP